MSTPEDKPAPEPGMCPFTGARAGEGVPETTAAPAATVEAPAAPVSRPAPRPKAAGSNEPRKTLLLTGASRGIGHATVKRFSAAGWRVITCSRHAFPEECPWGAGPEDHIQVDLADVDSTVEAIAEVRERLEGGALHALVNNAGISPKGPNRERMNAIDTALDDWKTVFQVNFFAPIMLARGLAHELTEARGSIVNVTSIAGGRVHPFAGAAYATSKAALAALTREMAADFGPLGVRVNAIAPGEIDTAILSPGTDKLVAQIPLRRLGTPEEVARTVYFLCTDSSAYVTGAEIHINGGQHV
ncbi:SDR family oxidoreductase [Chelatococcus sambhunathii]|uniref:SDR family oxidoreductase n=1 Tax=Chelatococcus sambhunathii TaxID=363953 RepID=A0ABU1DIU3_9HYPH|nr:SDR family oxidoreductase [Chelatococcus sambhunathii]MDR4307933.1 SDR family oxidoreductase [Chelatococcus sambhunathii]